MEADALRARVAALEDQLAGARAEAQAAVIAADQGAVELEARYVSLVASNEDLLQRAAAQEQRAEAAAKVGGGALHAGVGWGGARRARRGRHRLRR